MVSEEGSQFQRGNHGNQNIAHLKAPVNTTLTNVSEEGMSILKNMV